MQRCVCLLALLLCTLLPSSLWASVPNQLQRLEIRQKPRFTRITVSTLAEPRYEVSRLPGSRLRIRLSDTAGTVYKQFRRYADTNIGGLVVSHLGNDLVLTFAFAENRVGWRVVQMPGIPSLSLDVGPDFNAAARKLAPLPGRDRILSGAEKLLNDFDPPIEPEIPFTPTNRNALREILSDEDQKLFLAAEGGLYKGKLTAAEEAFGRFAAQESRIRPLALYRLAEAQYRLRKYRDALATFSQAVQLWPEFLSQNPAVMFYYGDSIARNGNLPGGRQLLARLIADHADRTYAPVLLVRLADVLTRQGNPEAAQAIYATVLHSFKGNKAVQLARVRLADQAFLKTTRLDYEELSRTYAEVAATTADFGLREESAFKHTLLEAIHGPANTALDLVTTYQKRYPKGVYSTVVRDIREDLVPLVYQAQNWGKNPSGLIRLATDNQEYLARTVNLDGFLPAVAKAFERSGQPLDLIALFYGILERPWAHEANSAYLTLTIADQAELLGDSSMTRKVLNSFLLRYPGHEKARWAWERLGAIQYAANELPQVRSSLRWLLNRNERAQFPVSYYYLGRSLWAARESAPAAQAMELYLAAVKGGKERPPLVVDAYFVAANARQGQGDLKGAATLLEQGAKQVPDERKDQFYYKLGELALQDGRADQARQYFEKIAKDGKDQDWQRMARLALVQIANSPPAPPPQKSKKK